MAKRLKQPASVVGSTQLRKVPAEAPIRDAPLRFRFGMIHERQYCCKDMAKNDIGTFFSKLQYFEGMTVSQARAMGVLADYELGEVPNKAAAQAFRHHVPSDVDSMCRLKVSDSGRLFGHRLGNEFHIVFWDPNHAIWPQGKTKR